MKTFSNIYTDIFDYYYDVFMISSSQSPPSMTQFC